MDAYYNVEVKDGFVMINWFPEYLDARDFTEELEDILQENFPNTEKERISINVMMPDLTHMDLYDPREDKPYIQIHGPQ